MLSQNVSVYKKKKKNERAKKKKKEAKTIATFSTWTIRVREGQRKGASRNEINTFHASFHTGLSLTSLLPLCWW